MKKYAVHRLIPAPDVCLLYQVVEVEEGSVCAYYPMVGEQPFTEWIGGTIVLSGCVKPEVTLPASCEEVCRVLSSVPGRYAWHITAEAWSEGRVTVLKPVV